MNRPDPGIVSTQFKIGRKKDYSDLVTEVDKKSEARIIEIIHKHFPDHNVLSEEADSNKNRITQIVTD
jgi:fructose-1,6-bisphosphatase/inositol monophosphatase family enzyme